VLLAQAVNHVEAEANSPSVVPHRLQRAIAFGKIDVDRAHLDAMLALIAHELAFDDERPRPAFASIWTGWTSVRKVKEGETIKDLFSLFTTEPNAEVARIHPKGMPVILRTAEEIDS
jgi:hypothetical protein